MFGKHHGIVKNRIESLIGAGVRINGNISFSGGMHIDGEVSGNIVAMPGKPSMLVMGEHGRVNGEISGTHLMLNGIVEGPVHAEDYLELQSKAKITGNIHYKKLEIHLGAVVEGRLIHLADAVPDKVVAFKLSSGTA